MLRKHITAFMKQNGITRILGDSGYESPWLSYPVVYVLAAISAAYTLIAVGVQTTPDSFGYQEAADNLGHGLIHYLRTPVYPLILLILRSLFGGEYVFTAAAAVQQLVFLVAILYFSRISERILHSKKATFWTTAVFALFPGFATYNVYILTESLSLSFVIFFVWSLLYRLPEYPGWHSALYSGLWLLALIFLRPVMLCLLPVYFIFWGYVALKWKQRAIRATVVAACMILVIGVSLKFYKVQMHRQFGLNGITFVQTVNNFCILRELDIIGPECTDDYVIESYISHTGNTARDMHSTDNAEDYDALSNQAWEWKVNETMSQNPLIYFKIARQHLKTIPREPLFNNLYYYPFILQGVLLPLEMSWYLCFMCLAGLLLIFKGRKIGPWILFLTSGTITGASALGAMSEWTRLFFPAMSMTLILASYIFLPAFRAWRLGLE